MIRAVTIVVLFLFPLYVRAESLEALLLKKGVLSVDEIRAVEKPSVANIYWREGVRIDFDEIGFALKMNTLLRTRYEYEDDEVSIDGGDTSSFEVNNARVIISGSALYSQFTYLLEADLVGDDDGSSHSSDLKDAYLQWYVCDWGGLQLGQFKTAVSRQRQAGIDSLQFPDRSLVSDTFSHSRQTGLRLFIKSNEGSWKLSSSIYNGESDGEGGAAAGGSLAGVDTKHMGDILFRSDLIGSMDAYTEGDLNRTDELAVSVGAAYSFSSAETDLSAYGLSETSVMQDVDIQRLSVDGNVKQGGFSFHGEFFWGDIDSSGLDQGSTPYGFYAQSGYMLTRALEFAARFGRLDCDSGWTGGECVLSRSGTEIAVGIDDVSEISTTLNYFWWKQHLKAQFGYTFVDRDISRESRDLAGDTALQTRRWIFQISASF